MKNPRRTLKQLFPHLQSAQDIHCHSFRTLPVEETNLPEAQVIWGATAKWLFCSQPELTFVTEIHGVHLPSTDPAEELWREQRLHSLGQLQFSGLPARCSLQLLALLLLSCRDRQLRWLQTPRDLRVTWVCGFDCQAERTFGQISASLHLIALALSSHSLHKLCFCNY